MYEVTATSHPMFQVGQESGIEDPLTDLGDAGAGLAVVMETAEELSGGPAADTQCGRTGDLARTQRGVRKGSTAVRSGTSRAVRTRYYIINAFRVVRGSTFIQSTRAYPLAVTRSLLPRTSTSAAA